MDNEKSAPQFTMDLIARLNSERFTASELIEISDEVHSMPEEDRDWEGRIIFLARYYPNQRYRAMAADERLTAMAYLISSEVLPLGVMPKAPDDSYTISEAVFEAAASEPLLLRGNKPYFEPESFAKRVLEFSEIEGKA